MVRPKVTSTLAVIVLALVAGCSGSGGVAGPGPGSGTITATVGGIDGQSGSIYSVTALRFAWPPAEASVAPLAGLTDSIATASYSSTSELRTLDRAGSPTLQPKALDRGLYSVVFVVSGPQGVFVAQLYVYVDGDVMATAPDWRDWKRTTGHRA